MAHKTFISYKHSESQKLRNDIIDQLGPKAEYYKGENGFSRDLTGLQAETIKKILADKIYDTTVMIVIVSPHMLESKWMEWEIKYALKNIPRADRTSHPDGIVCVIKKECTIKNSAYSTFYQDPYKWAKNYNGSWNLDKFFEVLKINMDNAKVKNYLDNSYIDIVTEDQILENVDRYVEHAFKKSENHDFYEIRTKNI